MRRVVASVLATVALSIVSASAADLKLKAPALTASPSPWDFAFGGALMTDYNFRGISQSDRGPSTTAYFEPRYNVNKDFQLYAGVQGWSVKLATAPTAEIDIYAGIRPTFGPLALDFGFIYYYYPKERAIDNVTVIVPSGNTTLSDTDYYEIYGKGTYTLNDQWAIGGNVYYSPSWLNTGADATYASITGKYTVPGAMLWKGWGVYVSGEFGHYWFGRTDLVPNVFVDVTGTAGWDLPDYNYWNIGLALTYKVFTLDFRYHDTDLNQSECNALTSDPGASLTAPVQVNNFITTGASKWCDSAFIVSFKADLTVESNLK